MAADTTNAPGRHTRGGSHEGDRPHPQSVGDCEQDHGYYLRNIACLPLDVLAGSSLLGSYRLASLAMIACVSRRMRDAATLAGAQHTAVSLSGPFESSDAVALLKRLPALTALDISGSSSVVSACLRGKEDDGETHAQEGSGSESEGTYIAGGSRVRAGPGVDGQGYLTCLRCLRTSGVQDALALEYLVLSCDHMQALGLRACNVTEQLVSSIAASCPRLYAIDLSHTPVDDDGVSLLVLQCDLRQLALRGCRITDATIQF